LNKNVFFNSKALPILTMKEKYHAKIDKSVWTIKIFKAVRKFMAKA
jgi:hypothetical protein